MRFFLFKSDFVNFNFSRVTGRRFIRNYKIIFILILLLSNSCVGVRYLKDDQKILLNQRIEGNKHFNRDELKQYFTQKRNKRFFLFPFTLFAYIYKWGEHGYSKEKLNAKKDKLENKFDSKIEASQAKPKKTARLKSRKTKKVGKVERALREGNTAMRLGEPLAIYDSSETQRTVSKLELFLKSKGFFNSSVSSSLEELDKTVLITYSIEEKQPFKLDSLFLVAEDSSIRKLTLNNKKNSLLKKGDIFDQQNLTDERERLTTLYRNNGYFDFSRQYIVFEVDSTIGNHKVWIKTLVKNPENRSRHKVFVLDSVNFIMDANVNIPGAQRKKDPFEGITYQYFDKPYARKVLNRRIFIRPNQVYSWEKTLNTQRQLLNMNNFKFININYDTTGGKFIANLFATSLDQFQISNEVGINYTNYLQSFPGPFYNLSLLRRNALRSLENMEMSFRIGLEGVATGTGQVYRSIEAGGNLSLTFPQFILPIGQNARVKLGQFNPKTRIQGGYSYINRPEYIRSNFNLSNTYTWENRKRTQFSITFGDISVINSELDSAFRAYLVQLQSRGNNLINTFRPSFVSSIIFSPTFNFNNYGNYTKNSAWLRLWVESGGALLYGLNENYLESFNLEGYKFVKLSFDFRKHKPFNSTSSISFRFAGGFAVPYSPNKILPYEKYFFAGGSNSVRGWRPRRLGPGSYTPFDSTENKLDYRFEQQGEISLEGSVELRQKLIGIFDGALFLDAGNIWTLRNDPNRPGSQFEADRFYKEIALAGGAGIRLDFSFLIIRFDFGYKMYDPARAPGKRFFLSRHFSDPPFDPNTNLNLEPWILNIGIGYPF